MSSRVITATTTQNARTKSKIPFTCHLLELKTQRGDLGFEFRDAPRLDEQAAVIHPPLVHQ